MKKVSVLIVGYNSKDFLKDCLDCLNKQTFWNKEVLFVDNASQDDSAQYVSKHYPDVHVVSLDSNIGYAAANNLGIRLSKGDYVLTLNPDVFLEPDYISSTVNYLEQNPDLGGVQGKLYSARKDDQEIIKSRILDSTGDMIYKDRHVVSRGQGREDKGQYDNQEWCFSLTGAAALFSREMLEQTIVENEYFDEDFFAYKEDTDLCWRARLLGWDFAFVPEAVAYHLRGWGNKSERSASTRYSGIYESRKNVNKSLRFHSFKNRYLMLFKNETWGSMVWHLPWIIFFQLGIILYVFFRERESLKAFPALWSLRHRTKIKRQQIMEKKKATNSQIRKWFR